MSKITNVNNLLKVIFFSSGFHLWRQEPQTTNISKENKQQQTKICLFIILNAIANHGWALIGL